MILKLEVGGQTFIAKNKPSYEESYKIFMHGQITFESLKQMKGFYPRVYIQGDDFIVEEFLDGFTPKYCYLKDLDYSIVSFQELGHVTRLYPTSLEPEKLVSCEIKFPPQHFIQYLLDHSLFDRLQKEIDLYREKKGYVGGQGPENDGSQDSYLQLVIKSLEYISNPIFKELIMKYTNDESYPKVLSHSDFFQSNTIIQYRNENGEFEERPNDKDKGKYSFISNFSNLVFSF